MSSTVVVASAVLKVVPGGRHGELRNYGVSTPSVSYIQYFNVIKRQMWLTTIFRRRIEKLDSVIIIYASFASVRFGTIKISTAQLELALRHMVCTSSVACSLRRQ